MNTIKISRIAIVFAIAFGIAATPASIMAHGVDLGTYRDDDRPDKAGVLVVALVPRDVPTAARQELMDQRIKKAFPGMEVRWSFFDIGSKSAEAFMTKDKPMSPKNLLDQMEEDGITHLAILPLAVIPGETYARLVWMVDTLRKMPTKFRKISLARPFFGAPEDLRRTCQTVLSVLPGHAAEGEAIVLFFEEQSPMGNYIYPGIQYYFWQLDEAVYIATAGTTPGMEDVSDSLKKSSATDVYLVPFLPYETPSLANWKTALEENGFRVKKVEEPVIGRREALDIMIDRLQKAVYTLGLEER